MNDFLTFNQRAVLDSKGRVSKAEADTIAEREYEQFGERRRALTEAEAEQVLQADLEAAAKTLPKHKRKLKL